MKIVYLNGEFLPLVEARISVLDRGFLFGDGVYEVLPVYAGRIFLFEEHFQRLENSLKKIKLKNPFSTEQWKSTIETLIERNGKGNQSIYLQITRGVMEKRDHRFPENTIPTVFIMSNPLEKPDYPEGVKVVIRPDTRWQHCDIKATSLLSNVLARQQSAQVGAFETILVRDGYITEGSISNVFIVQEGIVFTPPKSELILPGITRDLVIKIMQAINIQCFELDISFDNLCGSDEIWLTSSTREIVPVVNVEGETVGNGKPGPLWVKVWKHFQEYKQRVLTSH
jgi:D-alanine transaminase